MKVNKVVVRFGQTLQMRQFEPLEVYLSAEAEINEGEDYKKVATKLLDEVKGIVGDEIKLRKIYRKKSFIGDEDEDNLEKSI